MGCNTAAFGSSQRLQGLQQHHALLIAGRCAVRMAGIAVSRDPGVVPIAGAPGLDSRQPDHVTPPTRWKI